MISDDKGLPTSILGLFNVAANLYGRRIALYGILALLAIGVQYVVGVLLPHTDGLVAGLQIVVDAFLLAAVSIGVAFDLAGKPVDWSTVLAHASERWGVVAVVGFVYFLAVLSLGSAFYDSAEDTFYYLLLIPIIVLWGALALAQVVAAIEPAKSRLTLPLHALGKGMTVGFRAANIGRLVLLSAILAIPMLISNALYAELLQRHVHDPIFWADIPFDALVTGPLQALTTVFYIDFLRRAKR